MRKKVVRYCDLQPGAVFSAFGMKLTRNAKGKLIIVTEHMCKKYYKVVAETCFGVINKNKEVEIVGRVVQINQHYPVKISCA